jgi:uncharacterized membrane protein required for colicin V production
MLDIYIIIGVSVFIVIAFRDGFSKKIFGFFGVWGGLIGAIKLAGFTTDLLMQSLSLDVESAVAISIAGIFVLSIVIVNVIFRWFGKTGDDTISIRNRIAGSVLGACQGLMAVSLVLVLLSLFDSPSEEDKQGSVLYSKMVHLAPLVYDYSTRWMPESKSFNDEMTSKIEKFRIPR